MQQSGWKFWLWFNLINWLEMRHLTKMIFHRSYWPCSVSFTDSNFGIWRNDFFICMRIDNDSSKWDMMGASGLFHYHDIIMATVPNHQPHGCLLNRLFRRRSKKTSKLRIPGLCVGNSPVPVNSPHKGPVTRKMFPFDDVIMRNDNDVDSACLVDEEDSR